MAKKHPDRFFHDFLHRYGQAFTTDHPGPQGELIKRSHELVSRQQRVSAVQDAHGGQMSEISSKPIAQGVFPFFCGSAVGGH
jgi:hypothetical protein